QTESSLILEGLEIHQEGLSGESKALRGVIISVSAPLYLANCKLINRGAGNYAIAADSSRAQVRNCLIASPWHGMLLRNPPRLHWTIDNSLIAAGEVVSMGVGDNTSPGATLKLTRNTVVATHHFLIVGGPGDALAEQLRNKAAKPVVPALIETEGNICQVSHV